VTPEQIAKSGSEHAHQAALFCWAAFNIVKYPMLKWMFAIPNGGGRGDNQRTCQIRGAALKAEGVKPGVSDILIPYSAKGMHGLFIEMKNESGKASQEQKEFGKAMMGNGYGFCICHSWIEARNVIQQYLD